MLKRALITGINGMDGSHLADFLIKKDYEIIGLERRKANLPMVHRQLPAMFYFSLNYGKAYPCANATI